MNYKVYLFSFFFRIIKSEVYLQTDIQVVIHEQQSVSSRSNYQ